MNNSDPPNKRTAALIHLHSNQSTITPPPLTLIGANIRPDLIETQQEQEQEQEQEHSPSVDEHQDIFLPLTTSTDFIFPNNITPQHSRHHSRVHSRNLSVYFPRPGTTTNPTTPSFLPPTPQSPVQLIDIPSAKSNHDLKSSPHSTISTATTTTTNTTTTKPRRGHHHRHSLSHNFFPFLPNLKQNQSPCPPTPSSAIPKTVPSSTHHTQSLKPKSHSVNSYKLVISFITLCSGIILWLSGSIAHIGLGYLIVSDAMWLTWLNLYEPKHTSLRRPFGSGRDKVLARFTRSIYLLFAGMYICKETLELNILSHSHHQASVGGRSLIQLCLLIVILTTSLFNENEHIQNKLDRYSTSIFSTILFLTSILLSPSDQDLLINPITILQLISILNQSIPESLSNGSLLLQTSPTSNEFKQTQQSIKTSLDFIKRSETRVVKTFKPKLWRLNENELIGHIQLGLKLNQISGHDLIRLIGSIKSTLNDQNIDDDILIDIVNV
ncbi:hypothetical protein CROQUDRAFT_656033 [Cronartium quercuum f. sp. fusiforme G11]|uniref:Uncharacterized protein n=1 Tax=Cronartium quercuum f. sp. fusiforme G11 TaxID=708437 RepID=A0A9P6TD64_9BASI|nr:hypothetical protein CROQUDRAFT_656033 [Cronartium quercuum f. sp. fusiforme G11]